MDFQGDIAQLRADLEEVRTKLEQLARNYNLLEGQKRHFCDAANALADKNKKLEEENIDLWQQIALLKQENAVLEDRNSHRDERGVSGFSNTAPSGATAAAVAGGGVLPQRSMTTGVSRDDEEVPRWTYGSFYPEEEDAALAARVEGTWHAGRFVPALGPSSENDSVDVMLWEERNRMFNRDDEGAAAAAAAGGGPSAPRTKSSHGPPPLARAPNGEYYWKDEGNGIYTLTAYGTKEE